MVLKWGGLATQEGGDFDFGIFHTLNLINPSCKPIVKQSNMIIVIRMYGYVVGICAGYSIYTNISTYTDMHVHYAYIFYRCLQLITD